MAVPYFEACELKGTVKKSWAQTSTEELRPTGPLDQYRVQQYNNSKGMRHSGCAQGCGMVPVGQQMMG